jgi:hypothetical protein
MIEVTVGGVPGGSTGFRFFCGDGVIFDFDERVDVAELIIRLESQQFVKGIMSW